MKMVSGAGSSRLYNHPPQSGTTNVRKNMKRRKFGRERMLIVLAAMICFAAMAATTRIIDAESATGRPPRVEVAMMQTAVYGQQAILTSPDEGGLHGGVAVNGDIAVVGHFFAEVGSNANQGAAYVFVRDQTFWNLRQILTASDGEAGDHFGSSVAISGDTLIIGAIEDDVGVNANQGSAYVFTRSGEVWSERQKLIAPDGAADDWFGRSSAIDGHTAVICALRREQQAPEQAHHGAAYVFVRQGEQWSFQQKLEPSQFGNQDQYGHSVAISGNTVAVGAPFLNSVSGAVHVFVRSGEVWTEEQRLMAGSPSTVFGDAVALEGDLLMVGASRTLVGGSGQDAGLPKVRCMYSRGQGVYGRNSRS
jgi:hypothetical protein